MVITRDRRTLYGSVVTSAPTPAKGRNRTDLKPPFYFRHALDGKRVWMELKGLAS